MSSAISLSVAELHIKNLGGCSIPTPLAAGHTFVSDEQREIVFGDEALCRNGFKNGAAVPSFELAGPREKLFFQPEKTTIAIVTCGGLCPGLNEVIRSITLSALEVYHVKRVLGFRYGYKGLTAAGAEPVELTEKTVDPIIGVAGTILGSSRGPQSPAEMVQTLQRHKVDILFAIGGDGTLRGASTIAEEVARQKLPIAVIGVPKTIDNDILWTSMSFGFYTAVEQAKIVIHAAHAEAKGVENGVGIVKLMGRESGFIAANATRASGVVNFCLIPEVSFKLQGEQGLLAALERRLKRKQHAVLVVSEGAGQDLFNGPDLGQDASGNERFGDIGLLLKAEIGKYLRTRGLDFAIKYIDPSYIIRSAPADTLDSEFCLLLGHFAVHAAMAGKTDMIVGMWNQKFVHLPIAAVTRQRKRINPADLNWQAVLDITGQPREMF